MSKIIKFEKSINEIVEFDLNEKERIDLVNYILYELTTQKTLTKFTKDAIKGLKESEQDGMKIDKIINACDVLINWL